MADRGAMFRAPAEAYDRFVGRYGASLAAALLDTAGIRRGQRAVDIGCGPGALTVALAERLGQENVAGVDPSEPFVEACRSRVPGARIAVGSAESLPFGEEEFDAALSQLVVNFLDDPDQGLAEMSRVVRAGGVVAGCVWDYAGEMTMLRTFWDAAAALEPERAGAVAEGHVMRFARPETLGALWRRAGLQEVVVGAIRATASYEDFDDLWAPFLAGIGPAGAYTATLGDEEQSALAAELRRRLGDPARPFTLSARAWAAVGRVPER